MEKVNTEQDSKRRRGNPWVMWGVGIFLIIVIGLMASPIVMKCSKKSSATTSLSNAKQIWLLLVEFDQDCGSFPNDVTASNDKDLNGYTGKYSNDYLGQFIAGGYTSSEEIFYAKGGSGSNKRPDDDIRHRNDILSEGECGFAYIKDLDTTAHPETPILLTPMYGDGFKFNTDVHNGKAVVLQVNGAAKFLRIDKDRHAKIGGGKTLFDAGSKTVWGTKGFDQTKLCYAKSPYDFTPGIAVRHIKPSDWLFGGMALIFVILLVRAIYRTRLAHRRRKVRLPQDKSMLASTHDD